MTLLKTIIDCIYIEGQGAYTKRQTVTLSLHHRKQNPSLYANIAAQPRKVTSTQVPAITALEEAALPNDFDA